MAIEAFAIDLDGTLLVGEDIHPANIKAIQRAKAAGIHVMIATARWSHIARRIGAELGINDLIVCCSGAQVHDPATGLDVFDHRLPADFTAALFAICNEERCVATVTFDDHVEVKMDGDGSNFAGLGDEMSFTPQLSAKLDNPPRIAAIQGSGCVARIRAELGDVFAQTVNIFDSIGPTGKIIITITAKAATKGAALNAACAHLGITSVEVAAFGDAENDIEMFKAAGHAVAMGQADALTKEAATFVSLPHDEGGVAHAIDRILTTGGL
ncbi:MAG: HAD-IIB family hydrolase [Pseudomonadota bacterium]